MKWPYYIKYKIKAACILIIILSFILLGNIVERNSFSTLDQSIASIYKDRLQVSQYIYEISNALYQKRLLFDAGDGKSGTAIESGIQRHNETIAGLIRDYEQTVLTKEEKIQWNLFKNHLYEYNQLESQWIAGEHTLTAMNSHPAYKNLREKFNQAILNLDALSKIQIGEGYHLQKDSHSIVSNRLAFSSLEISLVIVLGLFTLVILSATDKNIFQQRQNKALN